MIAAWSAASLAANDSDRAQQRRSALGFLTVCCYILLLAKVDIRMPFVHYIFHIFRYCPWWLRVGCIYVRKWLWQDSKNWLSLPTMCSDTSSVYIKYVFRFFVCSFDMKILWSQSKSPRGFWMKRTCQYILYVTCFCTKFAYNVR